MSHYSVNLHITKVDGNGKRANQSQDFEFDSDNLIENRRNAIKKAKEILNTLEDYLPKGERFSSYWEAERLNFKNFNCFSLTIYLHYDGEDTPIFGGDEEEKFQALEYEAQLFEIEHPDMKLVTTEDFDGEEVEVIEEDLAFLIYNIFKN